MVHLGGHGRHRHRDAGPQDGVEALRISDRRMLAWFYTNLGPHWHKVSVGVVGMLGSTAANLAVPLVMRGLFDDVIVGRNLELLLPLSLQLLFYTLAGQVLGAIRTTTMHLLGQRFVYTLRGQCYHHLMNLDLAYFERERTGDIMSRVSNDVGAVEDMVVHGTDTIISNSLQVIGSIVVMFYMSWQMAVVALVPLPVFVFGLVAFSVWIRPVFRKIREQLGEINTTLQERMSGIHVIKSFAREKPEVEFFDDSNREYWRQSARSTWMWSTFFPAIGLVTSAGMVVLIWYGAKLTAEGSAFASAGTVVAFIAYLQQFYQPIGSLVRVYSTLNQALASMARIFEVLDTRPDVVEKPDAIELGRLEGRVDIEHVSFKYDTGETVLSDVSVSAAPGETVAVVGRSGAGKTTLVNLIPRFYDPFAGRVLVDGVDVRDVTKESLRRNIAIVLQETFLFNASVKENLRYARPDATDEQIAQAARAAHAHDFIEDLDEGYDTPVGERGVRLSGGQKQRLSIARALLADPGILILDEATSLIDTEAEQIIQKALANLMQGRTTFVIAHRLSTIRSADKIIVIDDGQIVEQDHHEALMARGGVYAEMYNRQFQIEEDWGLGPGLGGGMPTGPGGEPGS